jgi:hypothetical protein
MLGERVPLLPQHHHERPAQGGAALESRPGPSTAAFDADVAQAQNEDQSRDEVPCFSNWAHGRMNQSGVFRRPCLAYRSNVQDEGVLLERDIHPSDLVAAPGDLKECEIRSAVDLACDGIFNVKHVAHECGYCAC